MSGHTTGEWFVGEMVKDESMCVVGDVDSVVCDFHARSGGHLIDDAHLIASAPELLRACQLFVAYDHVEHDDFKTMVTAYAEAIEAARAAIAKATGETK